MPNFSKRSLRILSNAHPDLRKLFEEVIKTSDCTILCSVRDAKTQQKVFDAGLSRAKPGQSPHNFTPSFAVDVVPSSVIQDNRWNSDDLKIKKEVDGEMKQFSLTVKNVVKKFELSIKWGGDFMNFKDPPHWEIENWRNLAKFEAKN